MAIEKCPISNEIEEGWRIVNLEQSLWVVRFIPGEERDSGGLSLRQLFGGGAEWSAAVDGLGYGGGQVMRFQFREAGGEDSFGRAEGFEELSGHAGAEAGR